MLGVNVEIREGVAGGAPIEFFVGIWQEVFAVISWISLMNPRNNSWKTLRILPGGIFN